MKMNSKLLLAATIAVTAPSHMQASSLKNPVMAMLDQTFNQWPYMVEDIVQMRKTAKNIQLEVEEYKGRHSDVTRGGEQEEVFVAGATKELIEPNVEVLGYIYDFKTMVDPLVKESLAPLSEATIDPKDAFILFRFFSVPKEEVSTYFYDSVQDLDDLDQLLEEFSHFTGDLLESFSNSTKRNYMQWKKEQKASA